MSVLVLQIGDIHISNKSDHILGRAGQIASATVSEANSDIEQCILLLTGDAVQSGEVEEFDLAIKFVHELKNEIEKSLQCEVKVVTIPGNHDLNLSGDQKARNLIINSIDSIELPSQSIREIALSPLKNYFVFSDKVATLTHEVPFFRTVQLQSADSALDIHLFNSAWMSSRHEKANSSAFPVEVIGTDNTPPAIFAISAIHHPYNWFKQPTTMRPLKETIERISNIVITGHEHGDAASEKKYLGDTGAFHYLEGGVLQERSDSTVSSFAVLNIDLKLRKVRIVRFSLDSSNTYIRKEGSDTEITIKDSRADRRFKVSQIFLDFLDEPDLPLVDSNQRSIRLCDIFTYPDLRENVERYGEPHWNRVKSKDVFSILTTHRRALVSSSPKGGKTSLAKTLFKDFHEAGNLPIFIDGNSLSTSGASKIRTAIRKAIKHQYQATTAEQYEQSERHKKVLIIDNLHEISTDRGIQEAFLDEVDNRFEKIFAFADEEFVLEETHSGADNRKILEYDRFDICEFGYIRVEELARRWLQTVSDDHTLPSKEDVKAVCDTIGRGGITSLDEKLGNSEVSLRRLGLVSALS